jgi:GTP-binding protein
VSYQAVLTKVDKVSAPELARMHDAVAADLARRPAAHPETLATSARTGAGLDTLRQAIAGLVLGDAAAG